MKGWSIKATTTTATASAVSLSAGCLHLRDVCDVAVRFRPVALSEDSAFRRTLGLSREVLEDSIAGNQVIYGVNTGYGSNSRYVISSADLAAHQHSLLQFIGCGVGEPFPESVVRAAILLRANALARGFSGVRVPIIERLLDLLNNRISPVVPRIGSVGASGDLCPSAYIARVLTGTGEVMYGGRRMAAGTALDHAALTPVRLEGQGGLGAH